MRARLARLALLVLIGSFSATWPGCFGSHADGDPPDAGPAPTDGGVWTDCFDALVRGRDGQPCRFTAGCEEPSCDGSFAREVVCLGGQLRFVERICTVAPVSSCEEYLAHDSVSDYCDPWRFEACSVATEEPCCSRNVSCGPAGHVIDEVVCLDGCVEQPVCDDYAPPPPELPSCRSASQCASGEACLPPGAARCGGACTTPVRECEAHADCGSGSVCVEEPAACSCDGSSATRCRPRCTPGSCLEHETCGPDGLCAPTSCEDGYACPPNTACAADEPPEADAHGCVRRVCEGDADCECGVCLDGQCFSGPGVCEPHAP